MATRACAPCGREALVWVRVQLVYTDERDYWIESRRGRFGPEAVDVASVEPFDRVVGHGSDALSGIRSMLYKCKLSCTVLLDWAHGANRSVHVCSKEHVVWVRLLLALVVVCSLPVGPTRDELR